MARPKLSFTQTARILAISGLLLASVGLGAFSASPAGAGSGVTPGRFTTVPARAVQAPASPGQVLSRHGRNVNVTNKSGPQSETSVAVDPTNPLHMLADANDLNSGATVIIYESFDRGRTWTNSGFNPGTGFCYDPWLKFNANGDAFAAYECSDQRISFRKAGQTTWNNSILVNSSPFPDRDMVTVDTSSASSFKGSVYVGYDEANFNNAAHVLYSRDGFGNWAKSPTINDTGATIGVNAAVGPNGTVYATWEDWSAKKLFVDKSTDGGRRGAPTTW